jgi:hypothetical protein
MFFHRMVTVAGSTSALWHLGHLTTAWLIGFPVVQQLPQPQMYPQMIERLILHHLV